MRCHPLMTTPRTTLRGGVLLGVVLAWTPLVHGQTQGNVVDTTVADRDPLATSLRRVEPGNARHSFANRLTVSNFRVGWSPLNPATPTATDPRTGLVHSHGYQYRAPGVRALIDRPEYVPVRGGGEVMIVPANTVFQLTLDRPAPPADTEPAPHDNFRDHRLNLQVQRVPVASAVPFPQASIRDDQPMPTLDLAQMRYPALAAQATPPTLTPVDRSPTDIDEDVSAESSSEEEVAAEKDSSLEPEASDAE